MPIHNTVLIQPLFAAEVWIRLGGLWIGARPGDGGFGVCRRGNSSPFCRKGRGCGWMGLVSLSFGGWRRASRWGCHVFKSMVLLAVSALLLVACSSGVSVDPVPSEDDVVASSPGVADEVVEVDPDVVSVEGGGDELGEVLGEGDDPVEDLDEGPLEASVPSSLGTGSLPVFEGVVRVEPVVACSSATVGLSLVAPEGWLCRVYSEVPGVEGFTLYRDGDLLNVTVTAGLEADAPCGVPELCTLASSVEGPEQFPELRSLPLGAMTVVWGEWVGGDAEVVVTFPGEFAGETEAFVREVLASVRAMSDDVGE